MARPLLQTAPMARHVHGVYAPAGDAAYATPNGEVVHVPQDFAFADTVVALDDEIPMAPVSHPPASLPSPPSRPPASYDYPAHDLTVQPQMHAMQAVGTGYSQPPVGPHPGTDPGLVTTMRGAIQRAKYTIDSSRGEMKELWHATHAPEAVEEPDPVVRLARRLRTFWSFFEWEKDDVVRAAWIGLAVFVIVVCGAYALK